MVLMHAMCSQYEERAARIKFVGASQRFMCIDVHKTKVKDRSCPIFRSKEITCRGPVLPGRRGSQAWQFIYE